MFLANIAFALNLIALAVGAFLVGWGVYKAEKCAALCMSSNPNVNPNINPNINPNLHEGAKHCVAKGRCATTFAKVLGIIVMSLAIVGMVCTVIGAIKVKHFWHEKKEMMEQNSNSNSDQNNPNSNTSSNTNSSD